MQLLYIRQFKYNKLFYLFFIMTYFLNFNIFITYIYVDNNL
jgi:hypothetical protein